MFFRTIAAVAALALIASPVAPKKRDMHIEHTAPITVAGNGYQGGLR